MYDNLHDIEQHDQTDKHTDVDGLLCPIVKLFSSGGIKNPVGILIGFSGFLPSYDP